MRNSSTSKAPGDRKVILKMTSEKLFIVNDVVYVIDIRKNLVFDLLLSENGFNKVFESDKFILTKICMFVEKWYHCDGLFKM